MSAQILERDLLAGWQPSEPSRVLLVGDDVAPLAASLAERGHEVDVVVDDAVVDHAADQMRTQRPDLLDRVSWLGASAVSSDSDELPMNWYGLVVHGPGATGRSGADVMGQVSNYVEAGGVAFVVLPALAPAGPFLARANTFGMRLARGGLTRDGALVLHKEGIETGTAGSGRPSPAEGGDEHGEAQAELLCPGCTAGCGCANDGLGRRPGTGPSV